MEAKTATNKDRWMSRLTTGRYSKLVSSQWVFVVMPVPDRVRDDVSGIQGRFLYMDWIPAFAWMTGI